MSCFLTTKHCDKCVQTSNFSIFRLISNSTQTILEYKTLQDKNQRFFRRLSSTPELVVINHQRPISLEFTDIQKQYCPRVIALLKKQQSSYI